MTAKPGTERLSQGLGGRLVLRENPANENLLAFWHVEALDERRLRVL